jgi:hypothetical protein
MEPWYLAISYFLFVIRSFKVNTELRRQVTPLDFVI